MQDASAYGLTLLNTPQTHTRLGQTVHQADTSPDLTWSTRPQLFQWEVLDDCMGSDHFPILIRFRTGDAITKTKSRASTRLSHITHWDKYRDLLQQQPPAKNIDHLLSQLCAAKRQATKNLRVPFDHPEPDRHLLTRWNRRLRILAQYRRSRHAAHHKARLRKIQRSIETYTTTLASDRWMAICETMNGQTHTSKVWTILRSLLGQRKTYNGAARVALREGISTQELAEQAAEVFFPQTSRPTANTYRKDASSEDTEPFNSPFTMLELEYALQHANTRSAPGADGVCVAHLRNMPLEYKHALLKEFNTVWDTGILPSTWKFSVVKPIPKPGKPPHTLSNLRPISLTSCVCKVMESMVNTRLMWYLEDRDLLAPTMYGFRAGLSTQDVLLRLKEDVLDSNSVHPRAVVAVDIRKAFDGVPHSTIMTKARALGIKGKMYNFIAGFLEGRSYQVEIGQDASTVRTNHVGVPQGSVISPTLFNIAMYQLPRRLANVPGLKHAVYADDVTVWTHQGSVGEQEDVLQRALNIIHDYAMEAGLHTAPDKTEFVVIHGGRTTFAKQEEKKCFKLHIGNQPIMRKSTIRILGMHLDENCTASTWFQRVTKTSKQILHALRRISNRTRGVNEREMRQFVQAFLVSRIMYGLPYHPVNRTQIIKLDRLLNEARRMVTGLPRYTRLDALKSCSKLNNLTELIDMHIHTQETRLRATNAGRYTLMLLGYDINTLPMLPNKTPPWEITVLTDGKPLPLNMDPNQRARRLNYAKRHARATSSLPMTERVVYTDAALPADGTSNTCYATAWYDQTNRNQSRRYHASADAMYSTRAELVGILDYLEWALEMSPQTDPAHHRVYTDSQAAHRACANVLYTDPVLQKIRHQTRLLRECGHDVTIHWVPGHCGIPGNEKAHRLARAHLLTALARASDTPSTFLATPPELADPIADKHITKQRRAAYLTAVGNPLSIPLLPSKVFTRRESVLLRRIQAGTLLTPFLLNRFHRGDTPPPVTGLCSTCNCRADLNHLCWECPVYNPPRLRALATIKRGPWPSSLRTWACPEPSPPDRAIEFWRALIMFLQDPAAPPVGDRLRDSHKIQAIQAAPT
ncbi:hypothetical protein HPB51_000181 [Rhipicephalus microplus]|uniref:Tick transposon n=1 Tax=Rhipicephalus microplus TaxID=6941 RepID=A0A9J6E4Z8_RHIMP|nr:hypothetical protein HPB51_000181 [Rhipicephalus microplus]